MRTRKLAFPLIAILIFAALTLVVLQQSNSSLPLKRGSRIDASGIDTDQTRILIEKSNYKLHLYEGNRLLHTYPVVLGFNPVDDKHREGDGCTPEGVFRIRDKYEHAKWSRFIWIDYPNETSWKRFYQRQASGVLPADASIGGEIGIHGVPAGRDNLIAEANNWTLGCISLTTDDILELYPLVKVGTEVEIRH